MINILFRSRQTFSRLLVGAPEEGGGGLQAEGGRAGQPGTGTDGGAGEPEEGPERGGHPGPHHPTQSWLRRTPGQDPQRSARWSLCTRRMLTLTHQRVRSFSAFQVADDVAADPGVFALLQLRHQRHRVVLFTRQQRLAAPPAAGRPEALAGPGTRPQEGQGQRSPGDPGHFLTLSLSYSDWEDCVTSE